MPPVPKPTKAKKQREKIIKIKLQNEKVCFKCGCVVWLQNHHIFFGDKNRANSDKYGLTVYLCDLHHNDHKEGVHHNKEFNEQLQELAKQEFIKVYGEDRFYQVFRGRYIGGDSK